MALISHGKSDLEQCKASHTTMESVIHSINVKSVVDANLTAANTGRVFLTIADKHQI